MRTPHLSFQHLSDHDLLCEVTRLAVREREATARLIACLAEVDARRLYLGEGCASLFTYCVDILHLSEHAAYDRIEVARAARRFPVILEQLAAGAVTLTTIRLLAPHLTPENHAALLAEARHRSRREVEQIVVRLVNPHDVNSAREMTMVDGDEAAEQTVINESFGPERTGGIHSCCTQGRPERSHDRDADHQHRR
ncbi:MAG: hypothetical protein GEU99_22475 [Luteitalea sp.]|nr:hypothetical protein [Luteitalea sp.]